MRSASVSAPASLVIAILQSWASHAALFLSNEQDVGPQGEGCLSASNARELTPFCSEIRALA